MREVLESFAIDAAPEMDDFSLVAVRSPNSLLSSKRMQGRER
jgi:hypothetical protein